jgi:hypothetical protein
LAIVHLDQSGPDSDRLLFGVEERALQNPLAFLLGPDSRREQACFDEPPECSLTCLCRVNSQVSFWSPLSFTSLTCVSADSPVNKILRIRSSRGDQ